MGFFEALNKIVLGKQDKVLTKGRARRNKLQNQRKIASRVERLESRELFAIDFGSAFEISGSDVATVSSMELDSVGNKYVAGNFRGTVDFAPLSQTAGDTLTARGTADGYIAKYRPDDSLIWVRQMGGDSLIQYGTDYVSNIVVDTTGSIYIGGRFNETAYFGGTSLTVAETDGFVSKLTPNGDFVWARRMSSGSKYVAVTAMGTDSIGNVYIAGQDFPSTVVVKISPAGTTTWSKTIVSSGYATPYAMAVNADGNVYVAGAYQGVTDFDPSSKFYNKSTYMYSAAYVLNLNSNGQFGWATTFNNPGSAPGSSSAKSIAIDRSGAVIVGGSYSGTVDFDSGTKVKNLNTSGGAYVAKLTKAGALTWATEFAKQSDSIYSTWVSELEVDAAGAIYAAGWFSGPIDLAPGPATSIKTPVGKTDVFVVKLTTAGNYIWDEAFGGPGDDILQAMELDSAGYLCFAGNFDDVADFDPDPFTERWLGNAGSKTSIFITRWKRV